MKKGILVLDFGSQYTQLIARRLREMNVFSEILAHDTPLAEISEREPVGIILSGGPSSVFDEGAPTRDIRPLADLAPLLGVCYGMQLITHQLGGRVEASNVREYGRNRISWSRSIAEVPSEHQVWMSHGDVVKVPPPGFEVVARSESNHPAALVGVGMWAFQFHPEVAHTDFGNDLIRAFVFDLCSAQPTWTPPDIAESLTVSVKERVPESEHVLCAMSGGVDSTVVGTLLTRALGAERVHCIFVDTGLLRKGEYEQVLSSYKELGLNVLGVRAQKTFFSRLKGITDPEQKRKIIGHTFIDVFKEAIKRMDRPVEWLAQGTLYPDVIESVSLRGTNVTIKSHHNVGGLPADLNLKLLEPVRELFKDEVRALGEQLQIPSALLWRHPFPGPGLAIRILEDITEEKVRILQECDAIYIDELRKNDLYSSIWQAFCVLLPVHTVGVQGDGRTYERVLALRAVTSRDGMTADWYDFSPSFLRQLSNRLTNEVKGINRVVYDVTSKPPGTIEWE